MASFIRYVNTASSGGDGTTNNTSGATAAYASLKDAADAAVTVASGDDYTILCTGTADTLTAAADFTQWTQNEFRILNTEYGHHTTQALGGHVKVDLDGLPRFFCSSQRQVLTW